MWVNSELLIESCPFTHQHMETIECRHHHIIDKGFMLLSGTFIIHLGIMHFAQQLFSKITCHLNPSQIESPFQLFFNKIPNLVKLKVFRSKFYPNLRYMHENKFTTRMEAHVFITYPQNIGVFCVCIKRLGKSFSRDVIFHENDFSLNSCIIDKSKVSYITYSSPPTIVDIVLLDVVVDLLNVVTPSLILLDPSIELIHEDTNALVDSSEQDLILVEIKGRKHRMSTHGQCGIRNPNPKYLLQPSASSTISNFFKFDEGVVRFGVALSYAVGV